MTENGNQARHLAAAADPFDIGHVYVDDPVTASERAVLGAMILSSAAAHEAAAILGPQHFAKVAHQIVFEAVMRLADAGQPVEPASVLSELAEAGMLARVGDRDLGTGGAFLHSLIQRSGPVGYHAAKKPRGSSGTWRKPSRRAGRSPGRTTGIPTFTPT